MSYSMFFYIGVFGAAVIYYLWLRDARIFYRTGLPGYRKAAYYGVIYSALSTLGVFFVYRNSDFIGLGLVLLALYMQGRIDKERDQIWNKNSSAVDRALGKTPRK
jgi:hypothetical protein